MNKYILTHIHTYLHTHTHTYIHTNTYIHTYISYNSILIILFCSLDICRYETPMGRVLSFLQIILKS